MAAAIAAAADWQRQRYKTAGAAKAAYRQDRQRGTAANGATMAAAADAPYSSK